MEGIPVRRREGIVEIYEDGASHYLCLRRARMRDSGQYSCTASNSLGHVSCSWTLLVNREYISRWILGVVTLIGHCMPQAVQVLQLHTLVGSCHPNLQAKGKVTAHTPHS